MTRPRVRTNSIVVALATLSIMGWAKAQADAPAQALRELLVHTQQELETARTASAMLTTYVEQGRAHIVDPPFMDDPSPHSRS